MEVRLVKTRGYVALLGEKIDRMAAHDIPVAKQTTPYHVTLLTKEELQALDTSIEGLLEPPLDIEAPLDLGLGRAKNVYFKVLYWHQGNMLRKQLNLPTKQFHVTLSDTDNHSVDKGTSSIIQATELTPGELDIIVAGCIRAYKVHMTRFAALETINFLVQYHVACMNDRAFDGAWRLLSRANQMNAADLAFTYLTRNPDSIAANMHCADSCDIELEAKRAMHYYAQAAHMALQSPTTSEDVLSLCVKGIVRCSQYTEFGTIFQENEVELWKSDSSFFRKTGEAFKNPKLQRLIQDEFAAHMESGTIDALLPSILSLPSNCRVFCMAQTELYKMPRFFRWLIPFRMALMSTPRSREDILVLSSLKISLVVTLTEEGPLPPEWFSDVPCQNVYVPVRNYRSPTIQQTVRIIELIDNLPPDEAALIHCGGGKGRAGVIAACSLMARGFRTSQQEDNPEMHMFPADSVRLLRHMRPGSIETVEQENFLKKFAKELVNKLDEVPSQEDVTHTLEAQELLELTGALPSNPSIVICCGVPGSGKSTFAATLSKYLGYAVISQDDLGSRTACLAALGNALQIGHRILIDRCNPYVEDREEWLAHSFHPHDALCVWFDVDKELCVRRADARIDHPTIPQGRARKIITSFRKTFKPPSMKEKFACIARVPSNNASSELLLNLGVPITHLGDEYHALESESNNDQMPPVKPAEKQFIHKFPRTRHLLNLGSATRDDLVLTNDDADAFLSSTDSSMTITLEEKVDGANLGITLDHQNPAGFKVQNRSHYVTSKSHLQFKKLDKWINDHREGLERVLQSSEKCILYAVRS